MRGWRVAVLMVVVMTVLVRLDATAKTDCNASLPTLYQQVAPSVVFISAVSIAAMHPGGEVRGFCGCLERDEL